MLEANFGRQVWTLGASKRFAPYRKTGATEEIVRGKFEVDKVRAGDPISILIECVRHVLAAPMEASLKSELAQKTKNAMRFYYGRD